MIARLERRIQVLEKQVPGFLGELEQMFGPRDPNFEFGRIDPEPRWSPQIVFRREGRTWVNPSMDLSRVTGDIVDIHLTKKALEDPDETLARWQLAHECLHLIDPHKNPTNVLEEGLAVWYQNKNVPRQFARQFADGEGPYAEAETLVKPFMDTLPGAIRRIRKEGRWAIGDIPANVLIQYCPELGSEAYKLAARFLS